MHFFLKLRCLKNERNIWQNSALVSWGRILSNISFVFWAMELQEKLLLRFTDLYWGLLEPEAAVGYSGTGVPELFFSGRLLTSFLSLQLNNTSANACKCIYLFSCQIIVRPGAYWVLLFWRPCCTNTVKSQARSESCIYVLRKPAT